MKKDDYTIMFFPGALAAPKKFRVSSHVFMSAILLTVLLIFSLSSATYFFSKKYFEFEGNEVELAKLRRESKVQKVLVGKFAQQVKNFETEMARLDRFAKKLRVITALENSPAAVAKNWGVGGPHGLSPNSLSTSLQVETLALVEKLDNDIDQLDRLAKLQVISFQELDEFFKSQKSLLSATPSVWPTRGWVTSGFGFRKSPFTGVREKHEGWDIATRGGSSIRATADGLVVVEGREYGYGKLIEIDHGYGVVTRYGHNSKHIVKVGDRVKRGQVIARVGSTGRSTGPHLHYEVILNGVPVNPKNYILED